MPSFDVVSKLEWSEVKNALDQAQRELSQRYDFKGTDSKVEKTDAGLMLYSSADERVKAAFGIVLDKLARRNVSLKHFKAKDPIPGPGGSRKMMVAVSEGIDKDKAKQIIQHIKDQKLKVQASIQEDTVRVTGKKKDELQGVIADLKQQDFGIALQFVNFRN